MVKLTGLFSKLARHRVMVVGDLILDTYTIGKARRISPEAPVAIVNVQKEEHRPGGAGNVALNLVSLGIDVVAVGRIGNDPAGDRLLNALRSENVDVRGICQQKGFQTPVKNRIIAENQQIVRIDHEVIAPIADDLEKQLIQMIPQLLQEVKVVAISDYGKGLLSRALLQAIITQAKLKKIPVISDPKGIDFTKYSGTTIIKPNLGEAYAAANMPSDALLDQVAARGLQSAQAEILMVTRSEAGISLFHRNGERQDFPVKVREVKDVTGAGDTVLAMLACAMANELSITVAAQLANVAAGMAIERFGCARITLSELARRLLEEDVGNKVFDEEHLFALQAALQNSPFVLLSISGQEGMTSTLFNAIRKHSQSERELLIYIQEDQPDPEFVNLLASLREVNFILLKCDDFKSVCTKLKPVEIHTIERTMADKR